MPDELVLSVSDFVGLLNQTLEIAYPSVTIVGELANFRVSKNKWVYFDLKDDYSSVKFFGVVYQMPGPLEDGLMVQVRGAPRLHNQFGFSMHVQSLQLVGEGSIKKAAALLETKLAKEGLFDESRKRPLPYPPTSIGLITSGESAAYHDFIKNLNERWSGLDIRLADVQVQGQAAPGQLVAAIEYFNAHAEPVDVLVVTRGGGSAEDLAAFSTEQVTRAIAASRIPTLVAIGHEVDVSLAELAADRRASTPSNAAELLTPAKTTELVRLQAASSELFGLVERLHKTWRDNHASTIEELHSVLKRVVADVETALATQRTLLEALNPSAAMQRGYAIVRDQQGSVVRSGGGVTVGDVLQVLLQDAIITATVDKIE